MAVYIQSIDLSVLGNHARIDPGFGQTLSNDILSVVLGGFITNNLRLESSAGFVDLKNNYGISTILQPPFFSSRLRFSLSYSRDTRLKTDNIVLGTTFSFGPSKTLTRRLREDEF